MIDTAIILAAGLGTRLAPLSRVRAKAALPVAGETLIRRQVRWLAAAGIRRAIVNLHHLPATITATLGHGEDLGVDVRYSWEPRVLGSAGGPRRAFDLVEADRCVIVNGDVLTDLDLGALCRVHDSSGALVTLATETATRPGYNALVADVDGALAGVSRHGEPVRPELAGLRHLHFIGVQVAERHAFDGVSPDEPSETVKWLYPRLLAAHPRSVRVWPSDASYHDVGTPAEYLATVRTVAAAEGRPLDRGARTDVAATAEVTASVLWDDVHVGPDAQLVECIVADGVQVPAGLRLARACVVSRAAGPPAAGEYVAGDAIVAPFAAAQATPARG